MKLIFATDHRFIEVGNEIYSETQFPSYLWKRYLDLNDSNTLIVVSRQGGFPNNKSIANLELSSTSFVEFKFFPNLSNIRSQLFSKKKATKQMNQILSQADGLIARLPSDIGLLAIKSAITLNKPWAVELAGCPWDALWNYGSWQGKLYAPLYTSRVRRAVYQAPFALYVTKNFLQQRYPCSNGVVEACSNVEIPEPSEKVIHQRLNKIKSDERTITFGLIGSLKTRIKGIQTALAALEQLQSTDAQFPKIELRILGGGDPQSWLEQTKQRGIESLVHFDGTLPGGEPVLHWLDNIDVYLQPSFKEGLPRALIEAMSRGCPTIASNVGGIPELLDSNCLIKPGKVKQLQSLMLFSAKNSSWRYQTAYQNWLKSSEYSQNVLQPRRKNFWKSFTEYIRNYTQN